ncbi:hypothetical protein QFC22_005098 [Naganishia vaughanmartiniae]|uniref:Uncharacterized protein n=1 Tax=Naganishia vaughanmartiniae TaxID=1424756 RepID=A0ACC2WXC1_9TREE|nr:hypothetical protein QFC22_005098 [Naganishia vaughanmartiniae]
MFTFNVIEKTTLFTCWIALFSVAAAHNQLQNHKTSKNAKPNFVYIIADDQDAATFNPELMPITAGWLSDGTNYTNFFAPVSVCCPSRVSFLRSQYAHNHNITDVVVPYGGWDTFESYGYNGKWLPSWLQEAGYQTYYTGKLMNGNNIMNAVTRPTAGFNGSDIFLDPYTYSYINTSISHNGGPPIKNTTYSTDIVRDIGLGYIDAAVQSDQPFFIGLAPIGPHSQSLPAPPLPYRFFPPVSAPRHATLFNNTLAPRGNSFNPDWPSGASWVRTLAQANETVIEWYDYWYQQRIRALQAVDEMVGAIFEKLASENLLNNTYVIYTADNGFSIAQHRRDPGKGTGYEEDIRVPFMVRGPGIEPGINEVTAHNVADISATIANVAGAEADYDIDGRVMPWGSANAKTRDIGTPTHHLSEYWGTTIGETKYTQGIIYPNNTYRTLRLIEDDNNWAYTVWCTGERELFNMKNDTTQMHNDLEGLGVAAQSKFFNSTLSQAARVASRLDGLALFLKTCKGADCRFAWKHLFPNGEVTTMKQALNTVYDQYFDRLPKIQFTSCDLGYFNAHELPYWSTNLAFFHDLDTPNITLPLYKRDPEAYAWLQCGS